MVAWLAFVISLASLGFSLYQYWRSTLSPYSLIAMPPVITQANDPNPSLILDISLVNTGGKSAILTKVVVRSASKGKELPIILYAQHVLETQANFSSLPLGEGRKSSVFLPILIRHDETVNLTLLCNPYVSSLPLNEVDLLAIDGLVLDLWINGLEKKRVFGLGYPDYRDKFKGNGQFEIPKEGFPPRWYPEVQPVRMTKSKVRPAYGQV